jgi:hypothetical protein
VRLIKLSEIAKIYERTFRKALLGHTIKTSQIGYHWLSSFFQRQSWLMQNDSYRKNKTYSQAQENLLLKSFSYHIVAYVLLLLLISIQFV